MSAPLVVNTVDGTCWTRRKATRDGQPLYAMADCARCPELVMATYAELEDHGIAGSADVLPVPAGDVPQPLSAKRLAEIRSLDLLSMMSDRVAPVISGHLAALLDEIDRLQAERRETNEWVDDAAEALRASRDRIAELEALVSSASEFRVWEPGYGLYVRRAPGGTGFAILEANRTSRGRRMWTLSGWRYADLLSVEERFCWPDAVAAVAEARRVMPGALADGITVAVAPTQALRESLPSAEWLAETFSPRPVGEGEFHDALHHAYKTPHDLDLPETGGA